MKSFFVTGTDTEIGKSLAAAALLHGFVQQGRRVAGMKPVAAGAQWVDGAWHNEDVGQLAAASNVALPAADVCPYLLQAACAPHIAAELEDAHIDIERIRQSHAAIQTQVDVCVVEGVGGFRVPLDAHHDTADLAVALAAPVILVVGMRLGCINHALLTRAAIESSGLPLAGWIANQIDPAMQHIAANLAALKARIPAPMLGHIPHLLPPDFRAAAAHLDLSRLI